LLSRGTELLLRFVRRRTVDPEPPPLLVELFQGKPPKGDFMYESFPFKYSAHNVEGFQFYQIWCDFTPSQVLSLRRAVFEASRSLDPEEVEPLTFDRLVGVMTQLAAESLGDGPWLRPMDIAELIAYECIGLSRLLALAKDDSVTEYFVDS